MIRSKDVNLELDKLESLKVKAIDTDINKGILKALCLLIKIVRDIRTNQVTQMKEVGIKLVKPTIDKSSTN